MKRTVKYLYYRGVRQAAQLIENHAAKIQDLTYRGAKLIQRVQDTVTHTQTRMYRGVAY